MSNLLYTQYEKDVGVELCLYSPMCQRAVQLADHMMQAYFANSVLVFDS